MVTLEGPLKKGFLGKTVLREDLSIFLSPRRPAADLSTACVAGGSLSSFLETVGKGKDLDGRAGLTLSGSGRF